MAITILAIGLLVFVGHFLAGFFERTKVPDVLILMLAGIVLGPVLGVVESRDFGRVGDVFATLALIIILFEGGIHLNLRHLAAAAADTLTVSLATMAVTVLSLAYLGELLLSIDFPTALLVATVLGGTSSAVVVPLLRALKLSATPSTVLFLESSLTDVLVIVLTLGLIQGMRTGLGAAEMDGAGLALAVVGSFVWAGLIGAAGAFVWSALLDKVRQVPNTVFTTIAYVFILFGIAELSGYSGAIAALAFGIAVANFPNIPERFLGKVFSFRLAAFADHERAFFAEAVFLVKTFFFVFLGVSISFADPRAVVAGVLLAIVVFLVRTVIIRLVGPQSASRRDAALMTALVPKGLAAAVLASLPLQAGLPRAETIQATVYAVVFFTIVFSAALVIAVERGWLDPVMTFWYAKYPLQVAPSDAQVRTSRQIIQQSLVVADLAGLQEPNPIVDLGAPQADETLAEESES